MTNISDPIILFGMCGCEDELSDNIDFYKDSEKIRNSYNYFNNCVETYEELESYSRAYKKNFNDSQLEYLRQLEEIYVTEHDIALPQNFVSACITFGIILDGQIIGFIMLARTLDVMLVVEIFVKKEYRGQGIGKKLFDYVLDLYKSMSFTLHVSVLNFVALTMYLKYNFIIVDTLENYYTDSGIEPYTDEGVNAYHMIRYNKFNDDQSTNNVNL